MIHLGSTKNAAQIGKEVEALKALRSSLGWQIVQGVARNEVMAAAMQMASDMRMPESEMHFRRGTIFAGSRLETMVDKLIQNLENDYAIQAAYEDNQRVLRDRAKKGDVPDAI